MLTDGTEFDSSYGRGVPLDFKVGTGQVIEGWEVGVLGACVGEKRKLKIPPDMGYGETGAPPTIPGQEMCVSEEGLNPLWQVEQHSSLKLKSWI